MNAELCRQIHHVPNAERHKVYDTTTNILKSPYISDKQIKDYISNRKVEGSCCVAGMFISAMSFLLPLMMMDAIKISWLELMRKSSSKINLAQIKGKFIIGRKLV